MEPEFYILKGGFDEKDGKWYFGRARLFIINKFTNHRKLNLEYDFKIDVEAIKSTLEYFQIKVDVPILNSTKDELITCFEEDVDYFGFAIIFIFTHGGTDHFYCSDYDEDNEEGIINVWKQYYRYFSGECKPKLKECPKLFFNEWCQGQRNVTHENVEKTISLHRDTAHWLIYNAAQPTYAAYANTEKGSYSTQAFCRLLMEHGKTKDLEDIFKLVKEEDFNVALGPLKHLQPMICSSLLKKLFLLPEGKIYQLRSTYRKKFKHIRVLGEGKFGVVFQAQNVEDSMMYAVKRIQLLENTNVKREIDFLARSNCQQIVRYYGSWNEYAEYNCQKQEDQERNIKVLQETHSTIIRFYFIQMELCRETLQVYLRNNTHRDKVASLNVFKQIVEGLAFLHTNNIIHRDLKPANILFACGSNDSELSVRIADLGVARNVSNTSTVQIAGTQLYMPPEIDLNQCDTKWDMFSAGLILMELLYDCSGDNHDCLLLAAKHDKFPEAFHKDLKFALPVLKLLLSYNSNERPSCGELLKILNEDPQWEEVQFESICTLEEHAVIPVNQRSTVDTLLWNGEEGLSCYFSLSSVVATNTRWKVQFCRASDNFGIRIFCVSLDEKFRAASVRLFAAVEGHPHVWTEVAEVLKSSEQSWWCRFSKKWSDLPNTLRWKIKSLKVCVRVQWIELDQLDKLTVDFWNESDAKICCQGQLIDWRIFNPTSDSWSLISEKFGENGALWRIIVENLPSTEGRQLVVVVKLQHLPESIDLAGLSWNCSLFLGDQKFDEQCKDLKHHSFCLWKIGDVMKSEFFNPLVFKAVIHTSKKIFESNCTRNMHEVPQADQWSSVGTFLWKRNEGESDFFLLPETAETNTRWKVKFLREKNNFGICVRCESLDQQFNAVSVRLFAMIENNQDVWMEVADVLKSGEESWSGYFSQKMSFLQVRSLKMHVFVQWTELTQIPPALCFWNEIRFRWQLTNWKPFTPTSDMWCLFSETFGQNGALWRILVVNKSAESNRQLVVVVKLQHIPASVDWSKLAWNCSLSLLDREFLENKEDMKPNVYCSWIVDDVKNIGNSLDLTVLINVHRKERKTRYGRHRELTKAGETFKNLMAEIARKR